MTIAIDGQKKSFSFKCACCGEIHEGGPSFAFNEPSFICDISEEERAERVFLNSDLCVVDNETYFIRTTLEIPINGSDDSFLWGVWVSQSKESFDRYVETYEQDQTGDRSFGWLAVSMPGYSSKDTDHASLATDVVWGNERPELKIHDDQDHPLAVDQREGISWERAVELAVLLNHGN
ncbi:DUF2199 domain-containing protein [Roseibium sp. SCPC15]|uniref:DUF2199 domain-containing protein n=1 Tax=Roseibium sp. SCP15 TaxID=3141376 RepID=UPI003335662B